ncbi:SDR family NAD(P)-dependent oxidoreductase [Derxia gummosa]|uniref:SDR family NAD(P)-dependent oxidoreductase n=1 Tax=Derxia gummosa DSM 723 TaxID=1121388 RepID=A0A8B6X9V0_9BURK|nr:3-oxoacyl-ACP reductase family protein [Derxia gummosa]
MQGFASDLLAGRVAVVTGAASGIGRATAIALASVGASVAVGYVGTHSAAQDTVDAITHLGGRAIAIEADVADAPQVEALYTCAEAELGPIDIAVHAAGVIQEKPFLQTTPEDWDFVVGVDLKGVFLCCRAALRHMAPRGRGTVINIASELGFLGRAEYAPYCAAKAGVIGLTKSLAREFAPAIRVNAIAPGPIATPMLSIEHMSAEVLAREIAIPAQRAGTPEEVAATAVFLASDLASFFHGQIVGPNGGAWMGG